jgi:hypothetical protein
MPFRVRSPNFNKCFHSSFEIFAMLCARPEEMSLPCT